MMFLCCKILSIVYGYFNINKLSEIFGALAFTANITRVFNNCLFALGFNSTFSTNRLYRAITVG